ncbi:MAG: deoxynucleoside kinase [Candidatus Colwellbacteria bacterium]|nr:deoxynucleoside kinase [Candidatus Colwellbacteria bacterium]
MPRGKFIVIEGTDGSGKTVQFDLLIQKLRADKISVATFDFPRYGQPSAYFVERYLNGDYGTVSEVGSQRTSLFFALDRYASSPEILDALVKHDVVLSNRYVGSNMGHQGSKIASRIGRRKYFEWVANLEFGILGIPEPDLNIFLHLPAKEAYRLIAGKKARKYIGGKKRDIHEADLGHLERSEKTYLEMVKLFPKKFTMVECMDNNRLMSPEEIHKKILALVKRKCGF